MKNISLFCLSVLCPLFSLGQWTQIGNSINGQSAGVRCGTSTAISANGSIVAIGSREYGSGGQVRVFGYNTGVWAQIGADINAETGGDQTGTDVALSADGTILAIGEPFNNDLGFTSGQVRVFKNVNNNWTQIGNDFYGNHAVADAGRSVDLSDDGTVLAFGMPNANVNGVPDFIGTVRVFEQQNNSWVQKGSDINGDGVVIKFGQSVSLSADGNFIAVGQSGDPFQNNPEDTGRVKVYQYVGNQWQQVGNTIKSFIGKDEFGYKVSLSSQGNIVAIGTYGRGEVLVFELINGVWSQIGSSIFGNTQGDALGFSLSLSADGSTLAAGARHLTLNNDQPGSAYVFRNEGGNWSIVGEPIIGVAAADQAGFSVALTADGSKVVVASTGNDEAGSNAGQVRIFQNAPAVGIDKEGNLDQVKIYPNPSEDWIQINSNDIVVSYTISSLDGKIVEQKVGLNRAAFSIEMQHFLQGMYIITIQTESDSRSAKIIKK